MSSNSSASTYTEQAEAGRESSSGEAGPLESRSHDTGHPRAPVGHISHRTPSYAHRIYSVWLRHVRVYSRNLFSNAMPPFLEPLIFLVGIGLGLGEYVSEMNGLPYIQYLGSGLLVTAAMFTAAFECSFGTFIRLEFDKVYQGMLGAPLSAHDLILGELLWAATKGFIFTLSVSIVIAAFGILPLTQVLVAPFIGFLTGLMFGSLSLSITSFVKTINHFNFYFSAFISPMFFFSGVVFPVENLPAAARPITEIVPLTHAVRLVRAFTFVEFELIHLWDVAYIVVFITFFGFLALKRLRRRLID